LKADPRPQTDVVLPDIATTGQLIPVCEIRRHAITIARVAVGHQHGEARRLDRWRVRPDLIDELPVDLAMLASGRQSGSIARERGQDD